MLDFPSGPVVKNLPGNAGDSGLISGFGRYQHASEQLSSCGHSYTSLCPLEPELCNRRSHCDESPHTETKVAPARSN